METFVIRNKKDLEKYRDDHGYHVKGHAEFEYSAIFTGRLLVDGSLIIKDGWSIGVGGSIEAGWYIEAGEYIKAGGSIGACGSIVAGGRIMAGGDIMAGKYIEAGEYIEADGDIEAGESCGISAGLSITCKGTLSFGLKAFAGVCTWREISDKEKTITCGKFNGGVVEYGILKETGLLDDNKKQDLLSKADELIAKAEELKKQAQKM